jgi:GxxExxY protein
MYERENELSKEIIGSAIAVHRELGPGLLESAYEACLEYELLDREIGVERQVPQPVIYRGVKLECGYRLDLLVENLVIVELKTVEQLAPIHEAQLLTYLKLRRLWLGMLINFNVLPLWRDIFDRHEFTRVSDLVSILDSTMLAGNVSRSPDRFGKK